jgi:hypothetical protein
MTLGKAKGRANKKFIVLASLTIVTYDYQNIFIANVIKKFTAVRYSF